MFPVEQSFPGFPASLRVLVRSVKIGSEPANDLRDTVGVPGYFKACQIGNQISSRSSIPIEAFLHDRQPTASDRLQKRKTVSLAVLEMPRERGFGIFEIQKAFLNESLFAVPAVAVENMIRKPLSAFVPEIES
jgi:hypothetical protein